MGKRGDQHKANGWSGEGKMTLYYVTTTATASLCWIISKREKIPTLIS
ncbi:hypothetical protein [Paenibacillus larvae]